MSCLERTMQQVGQEIYSQVGTTAGRGSTARAVGKEPGIVEGVYHEI